MLSDLTNTRGGGRVYNSAELILKPEHNLETFVDSIAKKVLEVLLIVLL